MKIKRYISYFVPVFINLSFFGTAGAQSLEDYIVELKRKSSRLQAQMLEEKIAYEKINEASRFPDLQWNAGVYILQPETRVGNQAFKFGVSQQIPWFGTNKAVKNWLKSRAELSRHETALTEKQLVLTLKKLYYEIYALQKTVEKLKENKRILKTYEDMALAALSNHKASMTDVIKIRIQKNQLHVRIFQTLNRIEALQFRFNRLLERDEHLPVNVPALLDVTEIARFQNDVSSHPVLLKKRQEKNVWEQAYRMTRKKQGPKISFGLDYVIVQPSSMDVPRNGKDIVMPKIGLAIPLFNRAYRSELRQTEWQQQKTDLQYEDLENQLADALTKAEKGLENAIVQVMAAEKNINETQRAIDLMLKAYETGKPDFDEILKLQLQKIKFQLIKEEAVKQAFIHKAEIEFLTE